MRKSVLKKYLPILIIAAGSLVGYGTAVYPSFQGFLPCSYVNTEGKVWGNMTEKEKQCAEKKDLQRNQDQIAQDKKTEGESKSWPEYRDPLLGISIRYPIKADGEKLVFIRDGNILFVRKKSSALYARQQELSQEDEKTISLQAYRIESSENSKDGSGYWEIHVYDAKSSADIQRIVDMWYGKSRCKVGLMGTTTYQDVYNVSLEDLYPPKGNNDQGSCWINWMGGLKYSPQYQRLAVWDIGQYSHFIYKDCGDLECGADFAMKNSFRFIDRESQ